MTTRPDVVIVGGGLIGLLTAAELRERGATVAILEKDDIGFEQSARSVAAVNLPGGRPNPEPAAAVLRRSAEEWAGFAERWGHKIDLNDEGWFIVVADEEDEAWLDIERQTWSTTAGFTESTMLSAEEARRRFPQLTGPLSALDARQGGHVDAVMVMNGLRKAATQRGVDIRCGVLATGFRAREGRITGVRTMDGSIDCGVVVVAGGLWSPYLCDQLGLHLPMQRVRAPAVETGPLPPGTIPGFLRAATFGARQNRNGTVRITGGYRYSAMLHDLSLYDFRDLRTWAPAFWQNRKDVSLRFDWRGVKTELQCALESRRRGDGEVVVPQGYHPRSNPRDRYPQLSALAELIPSMRPARIHRHFSGVMDLMPDLEPVLGKVPGTENAYVATGLSGHGYLYGPGSCIAVAELISDGRTAIDLSSFRPERFAEGRLRMREQIF
jgi:glycine/D-amino acid oxidase-like deaminating enzyme